MKMKKLLSVLLASAVMIGAMTGCGGDKKKDEKKAAGDTIKVGVFLPLTRSEEHTSELQSPS